MRHTLLLLPGLLCDERVWQHQVENLSDLVDVSVPDFSNLESFDTMASVVLEQAPGRFYLAGHSMGGRVAMQILNMAPERIIKLALLDTGIHPPAPGEKDRRQVLIDLAREKGMKELARTWGMPMVHPGRHKDPAFMQAIFDMVESYSVESFQKQIHALLSRPDATSFLAQAPRGSLVLCGREDSWSPPSQHEEISQALPDNPGVVLIDQCGHMSPMEQPQAVNRAMREWLQNGYSPRH